MWDITGYFLSHLHSWGICQRRKWRLWYRGHRNHLRSRNIRQEWRVADADQLAEILLHDPSCYSHMLQILIQVFFILGKVYYILKLNYVSLFVWEWDRGETTAIWPNTWANKWIPTCRSESVAPLTVEAPVVTIAVVPVPLLVLQTISKGKWTLVRKHNDEIILIIKSYIVIGQFTQIPPPPTKNKTIT